MYVVAYKIEATDAGAPAYGCYMAEEGIIARYPNVRYAQDAARGNRQTMGAAGYTARHKIVRVPERVLENAESTRFALTADDIAWDAFENNGERYGTTANRQSGGAND